MAGKYKTDSIVAADLEEYLGSESDFAFELRCLELLNGLQFQCRHGGQYVDGATGKHRQFDIRAKLVDGPRYLRCAIECKNFRDSFPLLVSCMPRTEVEGFHHVLHTGRHLGMQTHRRADEFTDYRAGDPVGKVCAQVGRTSAGDVVGSDSEAYDKYGQALASVADLIRESYFDGRQQNVLDGVYSLTLPILVVPDQTLWHVTYAENGQQQDSPRQVDRCQLFVGRTYPALSNMEIPVEVSHLEITTLAGLSSLLSDVTHNAGSRWFPNTICRVGQFRD